MNQRFISFTGQQNPDTHLRMLDCKQDKDIWDTAQMLVNSLDASSNNSFVKKVLPLLVEKGIGVLAMKTLADGRFFAEKNNHNWKTDKPLIPDRITIADAMNFAWSLPISTLITGAENKQFLNEKIQMAGQFKKLNETERLNIIDKVSDLSLYGSLEYYKRD